MAVFRCSFTFVGSSTQRRAISIARGPRSREIWVAYGLTFKAASTCSSFVVNPPSTSDWAGLPLGWDRFAAVRAAALERRFLGGIKGLWPRIRLHCRGFFPYTVRGPLIPVTKNAHTHHTHPPNQLPNPYKKNHPDISRSKSRDWGPTRAQTFHRS